MPKPAATLHHIRSSPHSVSRWFMFVIPMFVFAVLGGGYVSVLRPKFFELHALRTQRAIEETLPVLLERAQTLDATRAAFERVRIEDRQVIDAMVPGGEDVPGLFAAIDAGAQRAGVSIAAMEVAREDPPSAIAPLAGNPILAVGITIRNIDYPRLNAFLDVLAASQRLMDVRSVQFAPESLTANIRVWAYTVNE